jgi:tetratricopeptide (TPR) repeat protein
LLSCCAAFAQDNASPIATPSVATVGDAQSLLGNGNYQRAVEAFRTLSTQSKDPAVIAGLARALVRQGDVYAAFEVIRKGVADYPNSPMVHEAYGEVLYRRGELWESEKEMAKTINTWGPNAQAYLWLARIYRTMAFFKKSQTMLERARNTDGEDLEIAREYRDHAHLAPPPTPNAATVVAASDAGAPAAANAAATPARDPLEQIRQTDRYCELVGSPRDLQIPLEKMYASARRLRGAGLKVDINGKPSTLLVDTGAGGIIISRRMAEKAGLQSLATTGIRGIGDKGPTSAFFARAESLRIGGLELRNCVVRVSDTRDVMDDNGLIGTDVFRDFLVQLDFPGHVMRLSPLPKRPEDTPGELHDSYIAPEMKNFSRFYRIGHYILFPVHLDETPARMFLVDTGAAENFIAPDAASEFTKVHGADWLKVRGLSGNVNKVSYVDDVTLAFSRYRQRNQALMAFDMSTMNRSAGMEVAGGLGFHLLCAMRITIDYRDNLIEFYYDEKMPSFVGNR